MTAVIVGAGGHGRETAEILQSLERQVMGLRPTGFLDDNAKLHGQRVLDLPVLGGLGWLETADQKEVRVVVAVGTPGVARKIGERVKALGFRLASVVSPLANVSPTARVGEGSIVFPFASVHTGAEIGEGVTINVGCSVSHDSVVGAYSNLNPGARVAGNVSVGAECYVGMGASVIQGVKIGDRTVVGAGAVVVRDLPSDCTAVGVPARVIKSRATP